MPQPTRYTRGESFISYATAHPAAPFPPANLEAELDDVKQTTDDICDNIALIQRDDGALKNAIVTPDSFSQSSLLLMAGSWTPRGLWVTAHAYIATDVVEQGGIGYVCAVSHTSGVFATDHTAGKWIAIGTDATNIPFTPTGTISSTNTQSAIAEVSGDVTVVSNALAAHLADAVDAHDASAISSVPAGSIAATDVQAAINELDSTIAALFPNRTDITGNVTLANTASHIPHRVTATAVVSLPLASTCDAGDPFLIKSYTTGDVTIAPNGSDTIDNVNASLRLASFECIELRPSGTDWIITRKPAWEVGNVKAHDSAVIPQGWIARGGVVSRATYAGLWAVAGVTFDAGDGVNTFGAGAPTAGRALIGAGTGTVVVSGGNADVDTATDALTVPTNTDKLVSTMQVVFTLTSGTITGLVSGNTYYWIRTGLTTGKLALTLANAQNGVVVDMTAKSSPVWTITHTFTPRSLGEHMGQEAHAETSVEQLSHLHTQQLMTGGSGFGNGSNQFNATPTNGPNTTTATGGNVAMPIMSPSSVTNYLIKT